MATIKKIGESEMGMTDNQFKSYVRFLLECLKDALEETSNEKQKVKFEKIIENLQSTLED